MKNLRRITTALLIVALAPSLSGCFGVAAVGMGAGVLVAADRRVSESYLADEGIEIRAQSRITEKFGGLVHINVTSFNRSILLTGEVPDSTTKAAVEKVAISVDGVKSINNELEVAGNSSFASRSTDTYITSKVKARFLDASKFGVNVVKVITENGAVYLRGIVTQREADLAVDIARTTGGVKKVVRVFEIISEERARQLDGKPAAGSKGAPDVQSTPVKAN